MQLVLVYRWDPEWYCDAPEAVRAERVIGSMAHMSRTLAFGNATEASAAVSSAFALTSELQACTAERWRARVAVAVTAEMLDSKAAWWNALLAHALKRAELATLNALGTGGLAPVHEAVRRGLPFALALVVERGANVSIPAAQVSWHPAPRRPRRAVLLLLPADPLRLGSGQGPSADLCGATALHLAAAAGSDAAARTLFESGGDLSSVHPALWLDTFVCGSVRPRGGGGGGGDGGGGGGDGGGEPAGVT